MKLTFDSCCASLKHTTLDTEADKAKLKLYLYRKHNRIETNVFV